ncbi:hypothetical protein SH591_06145 [Sphingomonas sp. LY54]|uniref:hypothetical protein n=1 Tax=Sphingomonas sp. LY54 TaxID=3095343 RepID=UPI002D7A0D9D|nr:hypothetical protein [Sphingomonas sp. LY54]WRP29760.1 hypothetical protein SH591_06145 [Sphingomonas sp. LY54]
MTKLAAEFRLSDVALHKICRKHDVPTPPAGYWAKKAHRKPVMTTPLPEASSGAAGKEIVIHEGAASTETDAMSLARAKVQEALAETAPDVRAAQHTSLDRTLVRLDKAKPDRSGLVRLEGKGLISVVVQPASLDRMKRLLGDLVSAADAAGMRIEGRDGPAAFCVEGGTVAFELAEVPDRIEHVATDAELRAVESWEAKQEAERKRYGYASGWGRPHIPKWEERYQGRLAVRLEEVRVRSDEQYYWGPAIRRVFADSRTRDILKMVPRILSTAAAIAVAKKQNRAADERRRLREEEADRRRAEAERLAAMERQRSALLAPLLAEHQERVKLRAWLEEIPTEEVLPPRVGRLVQWARARLAALDDAAAPAALEERLARERVFGDD